MTQLTEQEQQAPVGLELIAPEHYALHGYPHDSWARLRRESPVSRIELPGYNPFWAITKHADVREVSKQPKLFKNADSEVVAQDGARGMLKRVLPRPAYVRLRDMYRSHRTSFPHRFLPRFLISIDPPEHRVLCNVAMRWFLPRAIREIDGHIAASARQLVDALAQDGDGECDFVERVAAPHPAHIISRILGLPEADEPFVVRFSSEWFGSADPELRRGKDSQSHTDAVTAEFIDYISDVIEDRRRHPRDDLASQIANARIDGKPMGFSETIGYYLIMFTAGHETTRNSISGGLLALLEHPDEFERLRRDLSLIPSAIEEMVRWTSPVNYMTRRAAEDCQLRGENISKNDRLVLFYASANRDEEIFEDPSSFRVDRKPNPHLGFGSGEHYCMGAQLAEKTSAALFAELIPRIEYLELAGPAERVASSFVAGFKHVPIRYRIGPG